MKKVYIWLAHKNYIHFEISSIFKKKETKNHLKSLSSKKKISSKKENTKIYINYNVIKNFVPDSKPITPKSKSKVVLCQWVLCFSNWNGIRNRKEIQSYQSFWERRGKKWRQFFKCAKNVQTERQTTLLQPVHGQLKVNDLDAIFSSPHSSYSYQILTLHDVTFHSLSFSCCWILLGMAQSLNFWVETKMLHILMPQMPLSFDYDDIFQSILFLRPQTLAKFN